MWRSSVLIALTGLAAAGWSADIHYSVKAPSAASLGIYDATGRLVRTVLSGRRVTAGPQTAAWDGKDDLGNRMAPGPYAYRGLTANLGWRFLVEMGNAGKPPYLTADGKGGWGGVWGHVMDAVVAPGGHDVLLVWAQEEGTPALLRVNPHGGVGKLVVWGAHNSWAWGECSVLATDGKYVYVANNLTADSATEKGKKVTRSLIWRVDAATGESANSYKGEHGLIRVSEVTGSEPNAVGLAADARHLYCSLRSENAIAILDNKTGERVGAIAVKGPAGLAMAPDGNLYALAERQLVKYSPDGAKLATVIAAGLEEPYALCVDAKGLIYVSDRGHAMQVKVFTPDGKLVQAIGKAGGRATSGRWSDIRANLVTPTGPAVDADGTLYVGEDMSPKRVCIFREGKFAAEWIGPLASGCGQMDIADEAQPEYIYQLYWPVEAVIRYRVDYQARTQVVDAVWDLKHPVQGCPVYDLGDGGGGFIRHYRGKTFLYHNNMPLSIFRVEGYTLVPAARIDMGVSDTLARASATWKSRPGEPLLLQSGFRLQPQTIHDANGDGNVEEAEVDWSLAAGFPRDLSAMASYQPYVAPDLTVYGWGWKLPCLGLDAQGNPIYSWSKAEKLPTRPMGRLADPKTPWWENASAGKVGYDDAGDIGPGTPSGREINTWLDPTDGGHYYEADVEGKGKGIGWAANGIFARIGKAGKDGRWIWEAGDKATGFIKPGQFYKPGSIAGIAKGCIGVTDWNGQMRVFDKDWGLYVGSLFSDGYQGATPDENLISVEYNEAHLFTHPKTGQVYALAGDCEGLKVFEVTGVESVTRFQGTVQLPAQVAETPVTMAPEPAQVGWSVAPMPEVEQENLTRVVFQDANHGWILHVGGKGGPMYTADGGASWKVSSFVVPPAATGAGEEPLQSPEGRFEQHAVWFINPQVGWLGGTMGGEGFLAKSTDGGATWTPIRWPKKTTLKQLWFANERDGWIAPYWGEPVMRRTTDGGVTWHDVDLRPALTGVVRDPANWEHRDFHAFDVNHLVVVGAEGVVLRTADGGATWQASRAMPAEGAEEFLAVSFADATHGLAVGTHGITAATTDGGVTWTATSSGLPNDLMGVAMTTPKEGWAAGMTIYRGSPHYAIPGCLLHTADGGKTWRNVSPVTTGLRSVWFVDPRHGWAVGGSGGSGNEPARMILKYVE